MIHMINIVWLIYKIKINQIKDIHPKKCRKIKIILKYQQKNHYYKLLVKKPHFLLTLILKH